MSRTPQEKIDLMCELYKQGKFVSEIAKQLGCNVATVRKYLLANGFSITLKSRPTRNIVSNYFHTIDTPSKAYLVGFYFADGNVHHSESKRHYRIGLDIDNKDIEILEFIKKELNIENSIYTRDTSRGSQYKTSTMSCLSFGCKEMFHDLAKYEIIPRKTYEAKRLAFDVIPKELHPHYIRGLIDGDGSIGKSNHPDGLRWYINFTNYNPDITKQFGDYIFENVLKTQRTVSTCQSKRSSNADITFTKQEHLAILFPYLYLNTNEFALSRKRALAEEGYNYVMKRLKERGIIE